ncbi:MAG: MAPEG family protein [Gammaproteobacteria bacterium]|nr:MAPEG family protein [Gammaproteobacteria bacterium]
MKYTAVYASLFALFYLGLAYNVIRHRYRSRVPIGDGGDEQLLRAIRVHANAAEYAPLALLLTGMYELNGGYVLLVNILGAVLILARVLHLWGLGRSSGRSKGRYYGTLLTWATIMTASVMNMINMISV